VLGVDAEELYRLPPEDFTAARDAAAKQAKADGDKEAAAALKALRKPSVSAHLVNLLAAHDGELLDSLLALGPALAQAQAQGQGDALRTLSAQRRELVQAVTSRAVELGQRAITAAVREEVAATLEAALADPASAEAVRSGRLVRALSYAGFGDVDLSGAVAPGSASTAATPKKKPAKKTDEPDRERIAAAEAAALEAAGRLDDAVRACEQAQRDHDSAEQRAGQAHAEVERLRGELAEAERTARDADSARSKAGKAADKAVAAVRRAQEREEQARAELDRLRRGS
jgi:hypothetical protein